MMGGTTANSQIMKYSPAPSSKMNKEWLKNFIINNNEGIKVLCEETQENDYFPYLSFMVLEKDGNAIILFNKHDSSFIVSAHKVPDFNDAKECLSFYGNTLYGSAWSSDAPNLSFDEIKNLLKADNITSLNSKYFYIFRKQLKG